MVVSYPDFRDYVTTNGTYTCTVGSGCPKETRKNQVPHCVTLDERSRSRTNMTTSTFTTNLSISDPATMATRSFPIGQRNSQSVSKTMSSSAESLRCSRFSFATSPRRLHMDRPHTLERRDHEPRGNHVICREILSRRRCCSPRPDRLARRIPLPSSATRAPGCNA